MLANFVCSRMVFEKGSHSSKRDNRALFVVVSACVALVSVVVSVVVSVSVMAGWLDRR